MYRRRGQFHDAPFTPETCPGLTAEDCKLLNTPVEDCDPEILRQLLLGLAHHLAAVLPTGAGTPDAEALFGMLWGRLAAPLADAPPDETADDAPDGQQQAAGQAPSRRSGGKPRPPSAAGDAVNATPGSMVPPRPGRDRRRSPRGFRRRDFQSENARRIVPDARQRPAVRRLCYASCAGPP